MKEDVHFDYQLVVGLEVHIQLSTVSKLFVADSTAYGQPANTNVSAITLAHPGIMPKLNKKAVEFAIRMGLACNSEISRHCIFDRKNYFYPDLPKGFQTTQDQTPICLGGQIPLVLKNKEKVIVQLNRIHLEEDAGKSIHDEQSSDSLIDLNRAGVPLIELVTEPVISSSQEAMMLVAEIRRMVRYLDICDGNMEQGSLRCDANISIKRIGDSELGKKVEVKNMNSIRNIGRAIEYEMQRQITLLKNDEEVISETRLFDANAGTTSGMRTKEELNDYRYFPEPDLSPFMVTEEWLEEITKQMPATPEQLRQKFIAYYALSDYDTSVLIENQELALFFERVCNKTTQYKQVANWINGPIKSILNEQGGEISKLPLTVQQLADLVNVVERGDINFSIASKKVFPELINQSKSLKEVLEELNLNVEERDNISGVILQVLNMYPDKVKAYQNGKKNLIGMFMGEVMKLTNGTADPQKANELLRDALDNKN